MRTLDEKCLHNTCGHTINHHRAILGMPPISINGRNLDDYFVKADPYQPSFGYPVAPWNRWFAWYPVNTVDRGKVWLRLVWKRRIYKKAHLVGGADTWFQYAVWVGK